MFFTDATYVYSYFFLYIQNFSRRRGVNNTITMASYVHDATIRFRIDILKKYFLDTICRVMHSFIFSITHPYVTRRRLIVMDVQSDLTLASISFYVHRRTCV